MNEIKGKNILILGFGMEGKTTLSYLQKHYPDKKIAVSDQNPISIDSPDIEVIYGEKYLDHLEEYDTVIKAPGIPIRTPQIRKYLTNGGHLTSATNIFFSHFSGQTIGITGTKGKSTTTSLIHHILKSALSDVRLVGNIGLPMLEYTDNVTSQTLFVAELSSYQLEDIKTSPHIAVLLQIEEDHLPYHEGKENYIKAKANITAFQSNHDYLIYNPQHEITSKIANQSQAQKITFTLTPDTSYRTYLENDQIYADNHEIIEIKEIPLIGKGNLENTLAAITVALTLNLNHQTIANAVKTFKALEHRLEPVGVYQGISFYNDSIATTPEATINTLDALHSTIDTLIAGGFERNLDYTKLGEYINSIKLKNVILLPTTGERIKYEIKTAPNFVGVINMVEVNTLEEAVNAAFKLTDAGKACVLSPASASYNMFKNFEERGTIFKNLIRSH